jgi:hypothetical protein
MQSKFNPQLSLSQAALVVALGIAGAVSAQTLPKEGALDFTSCWSGTAAPMVFSKTHSAMTYEFMGTVRSTPSGGMYDNNSFRCVGMTTTFDGKKSESVVCEAVDPDGDKRLGRYLNSPDGKLVRETIAATGKYEGMVETSSVTRLGPFPVAKAGTFQGCQRQTGTYKLK